VLAAIEFTYIRTINFYITIMRNSLFTLCLSLLILSSGNAQPNSADNFSEGLSKMKEQKYAEALQLFNAVIQADAANTTAHYHRAVCNSEMKDYTGAIADFTVCIDKDLNADDKCYYSRAQANYSAQNKDAALNDYLEAARKNPSNAEAHYYAGGIYFEQNRYDEAIEAFTKAIGSSG
jgi:tetratricopeptide (TPR) repeat protein